MRTLRKGFLAVCLIIAALLVGVTVAGFAYAEDFLLDVIVKSDGNGGYLYGADETAASSLGEIFDAAKNSTHTVRLYFQNITVTEKITLAEKEYIFNGNITSKDKSSGAVFTVPAGAKLNIQGLIMQCKTTAIAVQEGGELVLTSGSILVGDTESFRYAVTVGGTMKILDGIIEYSGTSGGALFQGNENSVITIDNGTIRGNSACVFNGGIAEINGGEFIATRSTYGTEEEEGDTMSGYALFLPSDGKVTLNGGEFKSLKTPQNTVYLSGNSNSFLDFKGGKIYGDIKLVAKDSPPALKMSGRNIYASNGMGIRVKCESGQECLTPDSAVLSAYSDNGYKFLYWIDSTGRVDTIEPSLAEIASGAVTLVADNKYEVTFKFGSATEKDVKVLLPYGSSVKIYDYVECPAGYEIEEWKIGENTALNDTFTVSGNNVLVAKMNLKKPTLTPISEENRTWTYNGNDFVITANVSDTPLNILYRWEKLDKISGIYEETALGDGKNLTVKNYSDGGTYRCYAKAKDAEYFEEETFSEESCMEVEVVCRKKDSAPATTELTGTFSKYKTLASYNGELPAGFYWKPGTENIMPTCLRNLYDGIYYENGDTENYNPAEVQIKLTLAKGNVADDEIVNVTHPVLNGGVYSPDKSLKDYKNMLKENYYWVDETEKPTCAKPYYEAFYNPDFDNYNNYPISAVYLGLEKAVYSSVPDVYMDYPYEPTIMRFDSIAAKLESGYSFALAYSGSTGVSVPGDKAEYLLKYNADSNNYYDCEKNAEGEQLKLFLTVVKGTPARPENIPSFTGVYTKGGTLSSFSLPDGSWRWQTPTQEPQAGERTYVALYNPQSELYNDLPLEIAFSIGKATLTEWQTDLYLAVDYEKGKKLHDITLDEGYSWTSDDVALTAMTDGVFDAVYVFPDGNYYPVEITVHLTVNKGEYDMSGFVFDDLTVTYDGQEHSIFYSGILPEGVSFVKYENNGLTNSGTYTVTCVLSQEDETNYKKIGDITAILTINKAMPVFEGAAVQEFLYDGSAKSAHLSVNSGQSLTVSENSFIDVGSYSVTFVAEENENYLRAEFTVTVTVKKPEIVKEERGVLVSIGKNGGFYNEQDVEVETVAEKRKFILKITADDSLGESEIAVVLPKKYDLSKLVSVKNGSEKIEYEVKDGKVCFLLDGSSEFVFEFAKDGLKGWEIALICIGSVLGAAGIAVGIVFAVIYGKKRKKNEIRSENEDAIEVSESGENPVEE